MRGSVTTKDCFKMYENLRIEKGFFDEREENLFMRRIRTALRTGGRASKERKDERTVNIAKN